jgi:NAD(P)-dependent dehydrogenase (short-subunit alcohol dehydrogenase family)
VVGHGWSVTVLPVTEIERSTTPRLGGQVAVVTGAASGIGRALCVALAAQGAAVVAADVDAAGVERTLAQLEGRDVLTMGTPVDVRREDSVSRMIGAAIDRFGQIDILVACAGILRPRGAAPRPLAELDPAVWDAIVETNLRGVFLTNRAVLPGMIARRRGQIVNVSSTSGRVGRALDSAYCASKFGVIGLTESLTEEARPYGIKVHVVLPDAVDTPIWEQNGPIAAPPDALPPERVANVIVYLLTLPDDTMLVSPVIAPFRTRRRTAQGRPAAATPERAQ